jgi:hypothetical protein
VLTAAVIIVCGVAASTVTSCGSVIYSQATAPSSASQKSTPDDFSLPDAMKALYGNYDPAKKTSTFRLTKIFPSTFFDKSGKVEVHTFLTAGAIDAGAMKVFVLTYALPEGPRPFDCHACAPLIGAAVFAKKDGAWAVESSNRAFDVLGGWGGPPQAKMVRAGPDRAGFELMPGSTNQGETVGSIMILLPWKGGIRQAFDAETESTEATDCGDGMGECRDKQAEVSFARGANPDYDDIVVTISATETSARTGKDLKVHRVQKWRFSDGKYVRAAR